MVNLADLRCESEEVDLDDFLALEEAVLAKIEDPEWFGVIKRENLEKWLGHGAKIWLYYRGDEPVCAAITIPATKKDMSKYGVDYDPETTLTYGPQLVHPDYWGEGLQFKMLQDLDHFAREQGYKIAMATIHPQNSYSLRNFMRDKFYLCGQIETERGPRKVYAKKLFRSRAAGLVIKDGKIALIHRTKPWIERDYFVVPGGGIEEEDENASAAAEREVLEETGLEVRVLSEESHYDFTDEGGDQHFLLAEVTGGELGSGSGPEFTDANYADRGTYTPEWVPLKKLVDGKINLMPPRVREQLVIDIESLGKDLGEVNSRDLLDAQI